VGLALCAAALVPLAACGKNPYVRQVSVRFVHAPGSDRPDPAQVAAVRAACPGSATVVLLPQGSLAKLSEALTPIHYDAKHADDRAIAEVQTCVAKQPGVANVGLDNQDY